MKVSKIAFWGFGGEKLSGLVEAVESCGAQVVKSVSAESGAMLEVGTDDYFVFMSAFAEKFPKMYRDIAE